MRQVKATFYLPLKDNDGRDLSAEIREVENQCFIRFGAWALSGYFRGAWKMDGGERQIDTSAAYNVILTEDLVEELETVLKVFKSKTCQEAMYLELNYDVDLRLL